MLVKFAIDPNAIDNNATAEDFKNLLEVWNWGILTHPPRGSNELKQSINNLTDRNKRRELGKLWKKATRKSCDYRWAGSSDDSKFAWEDIESLQDLAEYHGKFIVALMKDVQATMFGIPARQSRKSGKVECVRWYEVLSASKEFRKCCRGSSFTVRINKERDRLWNERFRPFAEYSKKVVIIDGYAVSSSNISGLDFVLSSLDKNTAGSEITIYSAYDEGQNSLVSITQRINEHRREQWRLTSISSVKVRLVHNDYFKKFAHDRFVRFDNTAFHIGIGIMLFKCQKNKRISHVNVTSENTEALDYVECCLQEKRRKTGYELHFSFKSDADVESVIATPF